MVLYFRRSLKQIDRDDGEIILQYNLSGSDPQDLVFLENQVNFLSPGAPGMFHNVVPGGYLRNSSAPLHGAFVLREQLPLL